jgi:hypothetical protein
MKTELGSLKIKNCEYSITRYDAGEKDGEDEIKISASDLLVMLTTAEFIEIATGFVLANAQLTRISSGHYAAKAAEGTILCAKSPSNIRMVIEAQDDTVLATINDTFSLCFDFSEFAALCQGITDILDVLAGIAGFSVNDLDPIFLSERGHVFLYQIAGIKYDEVWLEDLRTQYLDEFGVSYYCGINDCHISKILKRLPVRGEFPQINLLGQSDGQRISEMMESLERHGYPHNGQYIILYNDEMKIRDGRHRASCLLHKYGNIKIPVLRLYLKYGVVDISIPEDGKGIVSNVVRCLCENRLKGKRIAIKGAGIHSLKLLKAMGDGFDVRCIIDKKKSERFSFPYEIIRDEELPEYDVDTVVISSYIHRHDMKEDIKKLGREYEVFDVYDALEEMGFSLEKEFYTYDDLSFPL